MKKENKKTIVKDDDIKKLQTAIKRYHHVMSMINSVGEQIGRKIQYIMNKEVINEKDFDFIDQATNGFIPCNKTTYQQKFRTTRKYGIPVNRIKTGKGSIYKITKNEEELFDYYNWNLKKMMNKISDTSIAFILKPSQLSKYRNKKIQKFIENKNLN